LTLALAVAAPPAADPLESIIEPYLKIHAALAADKMDGVKAEAGAIAGHAAKMEEGAAIAAAAQALAAASGIDAARTAFGTLSAAMVERVMAQTGGRPSGDVQVAYCPMARKTWLQKGSEIRNPYYGDAMLGCGEFKKPG
jgi:hypothetical protein